MPEIASSNSAKPLSQRQSSTFIAAALANPVNSVGGGDGGEVRAGELPSRALPIAAALWETTHAVDPAAAELAGDVNGLTKLNGEHIADGSGAAIHHQNDETNPVLRPEAG
jgi:hypothetical protein